MEKDIILFPETLDGLPEALATGLEKDGFYIDDHFWSPEGVHAITEHIRFLFGESELKKAGIGKGEVHLINEAVRGDLIRWIDPLHTIPELMILYKYLQELKGSLNRRLFLGIRDMEMHMTFYPPGSYYRRHTDKFRSTDHRVVTFLLYLNEAWKPPDDGRLILYPEGQPQIEVEPVAGRALFFLSEMEHEVLPTYSDRLSITGWMLNRPGWIV